MRTAQLFAVAVITAASLPLMALQMDANATGQQDGSATAGSTHMSENANASGAVGRNGAQTSDTLSGAASGPRGTNVSSSGDGSSSAALNGLHGANTSTSGAAQGSAATRGLRGNTAANGSGFAGEDMRPVSGELESKLDAKSARPGEPVVFKTTQKMTTADGTEIPKGTRLVGHVTSAEAHAKGHKDSELGIAFDRAELKGGRSIPIHSTIESIAPPPSAMMANSMDDAGMGGGMGGGGHMGGGPVMAGGGGGVHGGGLLGGGGGGLVGGAAGGVGSAAGRAGAGVEGAAGNSLDATGHVAGSAAGAVDGQLRGAAYGSGALEAHATGIPGVMLRGDASGAASGVLSASGRNVHLDSGTQMVLGVAAER